LAEDLARSYAQAEEHPHSEGSRRRIPFTRPRMSFPYKSRFHRTVRLIGLLALLASALGLLASVSGLPLNPMSMLGALLLSLVLIGYTVRPSLRKPKF
jgi:hypothetical protein